MAKIFNYIILLLIIPIIAYSQTTPPSGYTTHYKLRMWAQGARPSADSLNQNWKDIDSIIYQVSLSVSTDTTDIAYKSKVNSFTNSNSFTKANFTEIIFDNKVEFKTTYYTAPSRTITGLNNQTPSIVFVDAGYDTVFIHGIQNFVEGQLIKIVNISPMFLRIVNLSPSTTHYKIRTPTGADIVMPRELSALELLGIDYGGSQYYLVVNKNF